MQRTPVPRLERTFNSIAAALLGLPGLYQAVTGAIAGNAGEALYGLGKTMVGVFFLLNALSPARLGSRRDQMLAGSLLLVGLTIGIAGFLIKKGVL
jgi:hypothetical protein